MKNIHTKILYFSGALFLIILSILAVSATIFITHGNKSYNENTISVTGTSEVSSEPDVATFSFNVKENAKEAKDAQGIINKKVSDILDGLDNLGIDKKDIKTESYTIYPKYEWVKVEQKQEIAPDGTIYFPRDNQKRIQVGFDVSQNIKVKLRDLEKVSEALTIFTKNGVENLYGPNFEIDDPDSLKEEARLEAIKKAKGKAKRLAKDLGVKLGKIVSFNDQSSGYQPTYRENKIMSVGASMVADIDFAPELPTGENNISSTVTITYKIR